MNHCGNEVGVDHIFVLQPVNQADNLAADWRKAVFAMVVAKLYEAFGIRYDEDAFCFFDRNSDERINVDEFYEAMGRLQFTGEGTIGLMRNEVAELIDRIDSDRNGEIDFAEFRRALDMNSMSEAYEAIKRGNEIEEGAWAYSQKEIPPVFADLGTAYAAPACTIPEDADQATGAPSAIAGADNAVAAGVEVVASRRLPSRWPRDWELSDHIPVCATFRWQRAVRGR